MNNIKKYPVTYTLLALCILTYIGTTLLFSIDMNAMQGLACGGFNPYYVQVTHQYYRLITANFIHFGLMHIVVNCYSMYNLSCFVEYLMGSKKVFDSHTCIHAFYHWSSLYCIFIIGRWSPYSKWRY